MILKNRVFSAICFSFFIWGCTNNGKETINETPKEPINDVRSIDTVVEVISRDTCELEKLLKRNGLVDIQDIIPGIQIDLRYSDTANFLHADVYGDLETVYLQPDVAEKLKKAQQYLIELDSSLSLLVFDGVRPRSVQQKMWDMVDIPLADRGKFVSNPAKGSLHNFGAAVDISICDQAGMELDMGTDFDDPSQLAYPTMEAHFLVTGELNEEQIKNRQLLRKVMIKAGFFNIQTEWWHFNSCYREEALVKYKIIE